MCGIAAVVGAGSDEKLLKEVLAPIAHRGDHQNEIQVFDNVALGTNRLAIVDRVGGAQPASNEFGTIFAIQNGEIFNYKELTVDLKEKGHTFKTDSDTEVLVHLWEEYGESMVSYLDSEMFAFIIYDKKQNIVFVARDRIGVKPLFFGKDKDGNMLFASEMKALVSLCETIEEFPPGSTYKNGVVHSYYSFPEDELLLTHDDAESTLLDLLEKAVAKRVDTDLPIAVFLSGGVDSTLVMELATHYHKDVTALILGFPESLDYKSAVKISEERGWKYKIIQPTIDYEKELEGIVYTVENFDPNIVRHSFANDAISKFAHQLGFKVVLTGEGADEVFAGYNEFLELAPEKINLGCRKLLESMSQGNLSRIDRPAMRYTVEARCPFFDIDMVDFGLRLPSAFKRGVHNGEQFTKMIVRESASHILPEYIAFRTKAPFANGAGMDIGLNYKKPDGVLSALAETRITESDMKEICLKYSTYNIDTKEKALYVSLYDKFGYTKLAGGNKRLIVKDTLTEL